MKFAKMHGLGNDFIVADDRELSYSGGHRGAVRLCARRLGIGADGLILLRNSSAADAQMFIYNSDGSVAEMCGNGIRCFAKYAYESGIVKKLEMTVETPAGIKTARLTVENGIVTSVAADMGRPLFSRADIPMEGKGKFQLERLEALGRKFLCSAVNTGVPHLVVFVNGDFSEGEVLKYGPVLEKHPLFPAKVNVNFARIQGESSIFLRTWERGCGRTPACGTGSCAAAVCALEAGLVRNRVKVELAHGTLSVSLEDSGSIIMSGPAEFVFAGETPLY